ncbi:hypothetical protein H112_04119 [Trichophyton rubrum D6]|uniref:C6 finger domain transcription factor nscR n=2 Tax=Trichophyton rubrum TaxID=5551 RepID=F2SPA1_TRIRC|nr:uncharacterized protein TERG_03900 [Trichophyton rubrum CBS 118892]EZF42176.1 hypothetical protein H102_04112 [Trichophyton rubrum CBS 100081]EZF52826.1 hypothetical protein H103_04123 [Trichophyton rubrum CBS 288.86]EZF63425.1 hypothetical protein H104_04109 [Trichophyton rubrum CBS 289.86]EZF95466.1 hypothetical protein H113_04155 [Trichophyton rubrum MR1459]EZG17011.1 hypothetical protein H107_04240 [Trichophyton rubrum CBS 202.88]KDB33928.1 hypothetical protein H112_04119 [Trichophyton
MAEQMEASPAVPTNAADRTSRVNMFRKNGKPTSCEPCRISKVRCDHVMPICQRCVKKGISDKCYYHEAPLTRVKDRNRVTKPQASSVVRASVSGRRISDVENILVKYPASSEEKADGGTTIQNAYLGSTSFLSVFQDTPSGFSSCSVLSPQVDLGQWGYDAAYTEINLARLLSAFELYEKLIISFYERCNLTIIPMQLIIAPIRTTRAYFDAGGWLQKSRQRELYAKITQNTARPLQVTGTPSLEGFCSLFSGENIRWEFVGVIFSLAGLSAISDHLLTATPYPPEDEVPNREAFAKEMAAACNSCSQLCKRYDNCNDIMVWLQYTYAVLSSDVLGETSHHVYAVLGDLVTDIYGMGLHRHKNPDSDVPFFLSEVRKRLVAATYRTDKNIATFLGRPPRLPYHYCDASLPLDIDDDELFLQGDELDRVLQKLTHDGWGSEGTSKGKIRPVTAIRMRYFSSIFREKVLRLSLGRKGANFSHDLQETYQECKRMLDGVPGWFHYRTNCWETLDSVTCIVSLVIYLECIHTMFQIERIRCREKQGSIRDLLDSSMQAVSAVIDFTKQGEKKGNKVWKDFAWVFLLYALPTAGVLAIELHRCTVTETPLSSSAPRSEVVRNLSMIVSWFECTDLPVNATHNTCVEVSKAINKLLDDTLNYQPGTCQRRIGAQQGVTELAVPSEIPQSTTSATPGEDADTAAKNTKPYDLGVPMLHPEPFGNDLTNGISIGTGESFLTWLDELGMDTSIPEFLL